VKKVAGLALLDWRMRARAEESPGTTGVFLGLEWVAVAVTLEGIETPAVVREGWT